MTKRKDSTALFDLINKGRTEGAGPGLNVPGWFSKRPPPVPAVEESQEQEPPAQSVLGPFAPPPAAPEPLVSRGEGRVRFSMNYVTCAASVMGLLAVLLGAFWLGRVTRPAAAPPGEAPLRGGTVRPGGSDTGTPPPAATEREKGKWYLVIQRLGGMTDKDWQDAEAIVDYCKRNNRPCDIVKWGTVCYAVWSLQPFPSPDSKEARDYAKGVEELGVKYKPPPGRLKYDFNQKRNGKFDPTFVPAKE